ncbi:hypothetical protein QJQ45_016257, partial [Haematococcus lacustris]
VPAKSLSCQRLYMLPVLPSAALTSARQQESGADLMVKSAGHGCSQHAACSFDRPRGTDQLRGRVVLVDEHRTSRVSSAVNGQQPCEEELNTLSATRPAGWKPPAEQVEHRLVRPAWSQERGQPVRGLMWCPVVAPRKPPQAPRSSQAATQPAASEPGPSTPPPAKRSKPAAEPTKGKGKGKAAKAKPAPQPGRWLDRDCNAALNMQRIGESRWRPLELCHWPEQGALPAKGKEYPGLGYKRLRDKPPKAQQQQPAEAHQAVTEPVELPFIGRKLTATSDYDPTTHIAVGVDPGVTQAIKAGHAQRHQVTAGTSLGGLHAHVLALRATWDALWEEYLKPRWRRQRLALHHAQERVIEAFRKKVVNGMKWVSRHYYQQERGMAVFLGAGNFSQGGWKAGAVRAGFRKVVEQPSRPSADPRPDRLVIVDEFRTSRVSSSVHARQPCELHLPPNQPRPADWVPPAGQVNPRLAPPAQAQPPPPAQAQPPPAAPGPAPRPQAPPGGRWLDRDTNGCLNLQRIGESRQRPIELCRWDDLEALPPIGKEYQQGYKLGMLLCKPVFSGKIKEAIADDKLVHKDGGVMMWGFVVKSDGGSFVHLYSDDKFLRDEWVATINSSVRSYRHDQFLSDRYNIDYNQPLGTGLFAVVLRAEERSTKASSMTRELCRRSVECGTGLARLAANFWGAGVAIKVIKAEAYREYKDLVEREIMVWHAVGVHPHIVKLKEVLYSEARVYFVAELCDGGNLMASLANSSNYCERDVARILRQLLDAVRHCHAQGISHSDLKPENIVLLGRSPESPIKLIDFSLTSFFHTATEPGGTPEFVAPELLLQPEQYAEDGCGPSIDIWAVGVIAYFLLSGKTPFHASSMERIIELVKAGQWTFSPHHVWQGISDGAKDLISCCLQAQYGNQGSMLRTSWIRRSGVLRTMPPGQPPGLSGEAGMTGGAAAWTTPSSVGLPCSSQAIDHRHLAEYYHQPELLMTPAAVAAAQLQQLGLSGISPLHSSSNLLMLSANTNNGGMPLNPSLTSTSPQPHPETFMLRSAQSLPFSNQLSGHPSTQHISLPHPMHHSSLSSLASSGPAPPTSPSPGPSSSLNMPSSSGKGSAPAPSVIPPTKRASLNDLQAAAATGLPLNGVFRTSGPLTTLGTWGGAAGLAGQGMQSEAAGAGSDRVPGVWHAHMVTPGSPCPGPFALGQNSPIAVTPGRVSQEARGSISGRNSAGSCLPATAARAEIAASSGAGLAGAMAAVQDMLAMPGGSSGSRVRRASDIMAFAMQQQQWRQQQQQVQQFMPSGGAHTSEPASQFHLTHSQAASHSQATTQAAALRAGPSTPPPAKRSKAEQAAEPTQPIKGNGILKGKAAKPSSPAPQPGSGPELPAAKSKEYLRDEQLQDRPLEAQQQQQPAWTQ